MNNLSPFHLAIPVTNLEENRIFYRDILECQEGRSSDHWVDFNFFGHQLVIHLDKNVKEQGIEIHADKTSFIDSQAIPIRNAISKSDEPESESLFLLLDMARIIRSMV